MAKKISFGCSKGGVGRTTNIIMFAYYLSQIKKKKVLVADIDSQEDASGFFLGVDYSNKLVEEYGENYTNKTIMAIFEKNTFKGDPYELIHSTRYENLHVLPSIVDLRTQEPILTSNPATALIRLKRFLAKVDNDYDYILIDTKAETDIFAQNVYVASDYIFIVMGASGVDLKGMKLVMDVVSDLQENVGDVTDISGIILNKIDFRTKQSREFIAGLKKAFDGLVIEEVIRHLTIYNSQLSTDNTIWEMPEKTYLKTDPVAEVEKVYEKVLERVD